MVTIQFLIPHLLLSIPNVAFKHTVVCQATLSRVTCISSKNWTIEDCWSWPTQLLLGLCLALTVITSCRASLEGSHPRFMHVAIGRCRFMVCSIRKKDRAVLVVASFIVYQCWEFLNTRKRWEWLHLGDCIDPEREYRGLTEKIGDTWNSGIQR